MTNTSGLKDALCLSALALLIVIVFWPVLFEGRLLLPTDQFDTMTLPFSSEYGPQQAYNHNLSDAMMQSYPWKVTAQKAFRHGEYYYWNPLIMNGYPQYAASSQTYDVFNIFLLPFDLPNAFNLILVFELFTAGVGMYMLLRIHDRRRIVSLLFAAAWILNGMFLTHLLNAWALSTFCWIPFSIAMSLQYNRNHSAKYLLTAGFFLGLALLGSNIQSAVYALVTFVVITIAWSLQSYGSLFRKILVSTGIPCVVALFISAIMWLPATELFLEVVRNGTLYSPTHNHTYSLIDRLLSFILLSTFFWPELIGLVRSASLTSLAGIHPLDFSGYLGFGEMLMAFWAMFTFRTTERSVRPYAWLAVGAFLLPIFTPLFAWLYHRFFIVGTFGLTVLGAERLEAFLTNEEIRERGRVWITWTFRVGMAIFMSIAITNLVWTFSPSIHASIGSFLLLHSNSTPFAVGNTLWVQNRVTSTFEHYSILSPMMLVPFGTVFAICALLLLWKRWALSSTRYLVIALFVCASTQNIFWWRSFLPMLDSQTFPIMSQNHSIQFLREHLEGYRAFIDRRGYPGKQYLFLDNVPSLYGIPVMSGYESEVPRSFYPQVKQIFPTSPHSRALGFIGVKYLMFVSGVVPPGTLPVADSGTVMTYQDTFARPRASLYYRSALLPNDSSVMDRIFDDRDPHDRVLFSSSDRNMPMLRDESTLGTGWDSAHIVKEEDNALDIIANPSQPAYLVLSDTYYPGWKCFVDGREQEIYRVNYAMRGVFLTSGTHRITFRFEPLTVRIGAWSSGTSLLLAMLGILYVNIFPKKSNA